MIRNRIEVERYGEVPFALEAELGRCWLTIRELLDLRVGRTLQLSRPVGEDLPLYVGGALLGRGEVIRLNRTMGIRITELSSLP